MTTLNIDVHGRRIDHAYNLILTDPNFERRLQLFDPRLRLVFDRAAERWVILEQAYDNSGWNIILVAEDDDGNAKPLGEWVFNKLFVFRQRYEEKRRVGSDAWLNHLAYEAEWQRAKDEEKASDNHQALIKEDITQWRKSSKEIQNLPTSDATAGYAK